MSFDTFMIVANSSVLLFGIAFAIYIIKRNKMVNGVRRSGK